MAGIQLKSIVIPADAYMDVCGRATQDAKAEAGIQVIARKIKSLQLNWK